MKTPLWFCLSDDGRDRVRLFQQKHQPHWEPPSEAQVVPVKVQDGGEQLHPDIVPIMQATPADVKHNRGVFAERKS